MSERKFEGLSTRDIAEEAMVAVDDIYKALNKINKELDDVNDRVGEVECDVDDIQEVLDSCNEDLNNLAVILANECPAFEIEDSDDKDECDDEEDEEPLTFEEYKDCLSDFLKLLDIKTQKVTKTGIEIPYEENYKHYLEECANEEDEDEDEECEGCCCSHCHCHDDEDPIDEIQAILDETDLVYDTINDGEGSALVIPLDDKFNLKHCVLTYKTYKDIKEKSGDLFDIVKKVIGDAKDSK